MYRLGGSTSFVSANGVVLTCGKFSPGANETRSIECFFSCVRSSINIKYVSLSVNVTRYGPDTCRENL